MADLQTLKFYEIKAEDRPPFGKKMRKKIFARKIYRYLYLQVTQNEPIFFRFDITKQHRNNETDTK